MNIKEPKQTNLIAKIFLYFQKNRKKRYRALIFLFIFVFYSLFMLASGAIIQKTQVIGMVLKPLIKENFMVPINYLRSFSARPEQIFLDIKHIDYQKLAYYRDLAKKEREIRENLKSEEVNALMRHRGKNYKVKVRLTGTTLDHLENIGDKWSFRVRVVGDRTIFGMSEFNLQHPRTRNFIDEWIITELERREGIAALRIDFVDVTINGKHKGVYLLEEHFDKELMEHNKRREGILVRYTRNIFQKNKNLKNPVSTQQMAALDDILLRFNQGKLPTSKVFDIDKLATHYALSELVAGIHQHAIGNIFYYFNPVTCLLEPIGRERGPVNKIEGNLEAELQHKKSTQFIIDRLIFKDTAFVKRFIQELERISSPEFLDNFFNELGPRLESRLNILYKEYPWTSFNKNIYYENQKKILERLFPSKDSIEAEVLGVEKDRLRIKIRNLYTFPIEIINAVSFNYLALNPTKEIVLLPLIYQETEESKYQVVEFIIPEDSSWLQLSPYIGNLTINFKVIGATKSQSKEISSIAFNDTVRQNANYKKFNFIVADESTKKLSITPGNWTLSKNLIVPKEYTLYCSGNTKLNLVKSAKIISWAPVKFVGTEELPIVVFSQDSTGQGLVVLKAKEESILEHVEFRNLSALKETGWELTGAVTFYESPVKIISCKFQENKYGDDYLNIIRSEFSIKGSVFEKALADAFDSDFSKGEISNSFFVNCGNDGLDFSGSNIYLNNLTIDGAGDKGISVGEESDIQGRNIIVKKANLGLVSKDISKLKLEKVMLSDCNIGLSVYQKKSEFGPAQMQIKALNQNRIDNLYLVEENSILNLEGKEIKGDKENLVKMLYPIEK